MPKVVVLKEHHDEAYVLRTQELGEADMIVSLLAERCGKVRGVARYARRSRKRFGGTLEPMTHVRAVWHEKDGRDLGRIESMECVHSYAEMQADPVLQAACAALAELAERFAREGEADDLGFRLLGAVLSALESGLAPWVAVRYFELWTLRLHGLLPDLGSCAGCAEPLARGGACWATGGGGLRCASCGRDPDHRSRRFESRGREFVARALRLPPGELGDSATVAAPGGGLETLLRGTLEAYAESAFRTYRHLRALTTQEPQR